MDRSAIEQAGDLFDQLYLAGFRLAETADGKLAVSPAGRLTPEQREAVRANRGALLALVRMLEADRVTRGLTPARPPAG